MGANIMKKIALIGAGAMGSVLGAYLKKGGADVTLVDPYKEHMDMIHDRGLILNSAQGEPENLKMKIAYDAEDIGIMDYVIMMVKGTITEIALEGAKNAIGGETFVCTFQNGIGNVETIEKNIHKENILYGCLNMASILKGPGEVYGNLFDEVNVHVGSVVKGEKQKKAGEELADILTRGGANSLYQDNIDYHVWSKAMVNIVVNPTCALVRLNGAQAGKNQYFQQVVIKLTQEALAVAEAKGIEGLDFVSFFTKVLPAARKSAGDHYPSMAQDIMITKSPTEIDFLNGAIVRMGKEVDIETPVNETITNLIKTIEQNYDEQYY